MTDYIELKDGTVAIHPRYYLKEFFEDSSIILTGDLTWEDCQDLGKLLDVSPEFWWNIQQEYNAKIKENKNV